MNLHSLYLKTFSKYTEDNRYLSSCFKNLESLYNSSSRHYHNFDHIIYMLEALESYPGKVHHKDTLIASIFYHDAIYKSSAKDNELKSALLLEKDLTPTSFKHIDICKDLILATKKHQNTTLNEDVDLIIDLDLLILGQNFEKYIKYTKKVRKEYAIYPDFLYNPARKKAMNHFLDQEQIFKTKHFFDLFEQQARENIYKEIASL